MRRKNIKILLSIVLIFSGLCMLIYDYYINCNEKRNEEKNIEIFFEYEIKDNNGNNISNNSKSTKKEENFINYIAVLEIPKISLKKGLVSPNSSLNNVNSNIEIIYPLSMPDIINGIFILASHSGSSRVAYFDELNKLNNGDKVYIYYNNVKYIYSIFDYYEEKKDGNITVKNNQFEDIIVLTTCKKFSSNKQLVYLGNLTKKEKY